MAGDADVVVVGGGMAGLVAAVECLERGAAVVVLEKGDDVGGSMALSGGNVWTFEDMDAVRAHVDGGNRSIQRLVVESFDRGLAWLREHGVELEEYDGFQGTGLQCDPAQLTAALVGRIDDHGGRVRRSAAMTGLDGASSRLRVTYRDESDEARAVEAEAVILATGGFQGDETLVRQHVAGEDGRYAVRANPESDGAGLRQATAIGAATTAEMSGFYGHNVAFPPTGYPREQFMEATQYYGPVAVALGEDGRRFADESASPAEDRLAGETLARASGRAVYVVDGDRYAETYLRPVETMIDDARSFGANVASAETLDALCTRIGEWGFDGERALQTLHEFNEAIEEDDAGRLDPPRAANRVPLDAPPFYAVEVLPGITFTTGGLDVDEQMRAVSAADGEPIPGLFAAGADVGGVHHGGYMGGLATALVTGLTAAAAAADGT